MLVENIIDVVSRYFKLDTDQITNRKGCNSSARKLAIFLSGKHCRKSSTVTLLAKQFGLKISEFNSEEYKFELKLKSEKKLQKVINELEKMLELHKNIKT